MRQDDYVKIVGTDNLYRFGYVKTIKEKGDLLEISLSEEGESKIAWDAEFAANSGKETIDYVSLLTDVEKRLVPLVAANLSPKEIAKTFSIAENTVRSQLWTLRIKLRLDNRAQLVAFSQSLVGMLKAQNGVDNDGNNISTAQDVKWDIH